jgi:hypothetical protein
LFNRTDYDQRNPKEGVMYNLLILMG